MVGGSLLPNLEHCEHRPHWCQQCRCHCSSRTSCCRHPTRHCLDRHRYRPAWWSGSTWPPSKLLPPLSGTTELAMRTEASLDAVPEMLKQLPNLPPAITIGAGRRGVQRAVHRRTAGTGHCHITVEPLTLSKDKCNTGVLSTSAPWTLAHSDANNAPRASSFVFMFGIYWIRSKRLQPHR